MIHGTRVRSNIHGETTLHGHLKAASEQLFSRYQGDLTTLRLKPDIPRCSRPKRADRRESAWWRRPRPRRPGSCTRMLARSRWRTPDHLLADACGVDAVLADQHHSETGAEPPSKPRF